MRVLEPEWARVAGPQFETVTDAVMCSYEYTADGRKRAQAAGAVAGKGPARMLANIERAAARARGGEGGGGGEGPCICGE